jgi:hypothetical protein
MTKPNLDKSKPLYNMAGLDYNGPFYNSRYPEKLRLERRQMVTYYLPHSFTEYKGKETQRKMGKRIVTGEAYEPRKGLCRICGFPKADAVCAKRS